MDLENKRELLTCVQTQSSLWFRLGVFGPLCYNQNKNEIFCKPITYKTLILKVFGSNGLCFVGSICFYDFDIKTNTHWNLIDCT